MPDCPRPERRRSRGLDGHALVEQHRTPVGPVVHDLVPVVVRREVADDDAVGLLGVVDAELAARVGEVVVDPVDAVAAVVLVRAAQPAVGGAPLARRGQVVEADAVGRCALDVAVRGAGDDGEGGGQLAEEHGAFLDGVGGGGRGRVGGRVGALAAVMDPLRGSGPE